VALSPSELARYQRHLNLPEIGAVGQEKLRSARVLVVGAGGLGSPAALYLAAAGVGTVGLIDGDRVEISNLQRQILFGSPDIGRMKVDVAMERLLQLNPEIRVVTHAFELRAANVRQVFENYDVVLDGTDRLGVRYLINDACVIFGKPLVSAAIHRFEGQAMTYVPGHGPCYRCLFPEAADDVVPNCAEAGVLGVLPGVLGTLQATEALKLITGAGELLIGRLLSYDALALRFEEFTFSRRVDCAVCGDRPSITTPQDSRADAALASVRRLSPVELRTLLDSAPDAVRLIDVREPHEFAVAHLPGAVNIPVGQLRSDNPLWSKLARSTSNNTTVVFICRSGSRSLAACRIAAEAGVNPTAHMEGGLLAWTSDVAPDFVVAPL